MLKYGVLAAALLLCQPASAQNLVQNFSFETGDFTDWTPFDAQDSIGVTADVTTDGSYLAFFGQVGATGGIQQVIATTPGHTYTVLYDLALNPGEGGGEGGGEGRLAPGSFNAFEASFAGVIGQTFTDDPGSYSFQTFQFQAQATGTSEVLSFSFQNDPSFWNLDNVRVVDTVPELDPSASLLPLFFVQTALAGAQRRQATA